MATQQQIELLQALYAKKRDKGLKDLYFFSKYVMEREEDRQKFYVDHVHGEWASWYHSSKKRIKMILVPRGTFKSTFFTVGRCLQELADPEKRKRARILISNATLNVAQKFLSEIKEHLQKNEEYKIMYGELYDPKARWNESEIDVVGKALGVKDPSITAMGVGGNLVGSHYSMIIADDLVNEINSATRYQADKVIDWWKRSLSLLDPDGEMIIIGTRWAYFELYAYLLENFGDEIDVYIRGAYNHDGSCYFPELLNERKLEELKKSQGSYIFSSFYLNDPVDAESALIKKSQIKYYAENAPSDYKILPKNVNIFTVIDPAVSQEEHADYSSITTVALDSEDNWYVREIRRGKWTVGQLISEMFETYNRWHPIGMTIETIGQGQGLLTPIYDEEQHRGVYLPLKTIKARPAIRKEMRIRSVLQPRFERGKIYILPGMDNLEEELLRFPKSKHDDIIDSLTDVSEIGFAPDREVVLNHEEISSEFEWQIKNPKKDEYFDEYMGEDY